MKNFTARIASVATLALAALPVAALSTAAHAQQSIRIADLNLASGAGRAAFDQRVDTAARNFCRTERSLKLQAVCQSGVRAEANEKAAAKVQMASRI